MQTYYTSISARNHLSCLPPSKKPLLSALPPFAFALASSCTTKACDNLSDSDILQEIFARARPLHGHAKCGARDGVQIQMKYLARRAVRDAIVRLTGEKTGLYSLVVTVQGLPVFDGMDACVHVRYQSFNQRSFEHSDASE